MATPLNTHETATSFALPESEVAVQWFQEYDDMDVNGQLFMSAWRVSVIPHPNHVLDTWQIGVAGRYYQWKGEGETTILDRAQWLENKRKNRNPITFSRISIGNEIETWTNHLREQRNPCTSKTWDKATIELNRSLTLKIMPPLNLLEDTHPGHHCNETQLTPFQDKHAQTIRIDINTVIWRNEQATYHGF